MAEKKPRNTYKILRKIRWMFIISIGFIFANGYLKVFKTKQIYDGPLRSACVPFMNCHACPTATMSCPIGMLQKFASIRQIPYFLIGFLGSVGMIFGRAACGWLCPFGWVQDQMYKIPSKKFRIPRWLGKMKFVSLIVIAILLPYFFEAHWFSRICPWGTIIAGIPWVVWNPIDPVMGISVIDPAAIGWLYFMKISILAVFLVLFILTKRPFCRTTCPLGAIYAYFNKVSLMRLNVAKDACTDCDLCVKVCPVDIKIADDANSPDCVRCLKCTVCKNVTVKWSLSNETGTAGIITESSKN